MDAPIGLVRGLVQGTVALQVEVPEDHPSVAVLGSERMGSGVLVDKEGLLLTVNYVVIGGRRITAILPDGRRFRVEILAQDFDNGLAVLHMSERDLPVTALGESRGLETGQEVFILASTGTTERRVSSGVITALEPFDAAWEYMLDVSIQTSAVNPGFGGGALFDLQGRVVGITSLNLGQVGRFSLAIPIHLFTERREELRFGTTLNGARRAWVGLYSEPTPAGLVVTGLVPRGPAVEAGIREGDVVLAVNGREVPTRPELYREMWKHPAGDRLAFHVQRENAVVMIQVSSADRSEFYR
jgi:S1-C subfamily serine protease